MRSHIQHYQIIQPLGGGGFAHVYLAFDERLHREVALKVLHANLAENPEYRRFFEREARIIASLENLAVVPIYDFGEVDNQLYLVMRYMRGGTLAERLYEAKKALPLAEVIALLERLAPTFDAMHQRGVIHRDLKPSNILYDETEQAYIADFGIARMQQATTQHTQTGMSFGTPQYSSPEQITGEGVLDHRTDIYSLGIILYQLLTTEYPFWSDTPLGWVYKHTEAPIPDIRSVNRRLPEGLTAIIYKTLAKAPQDRYESVSALLADLKAAEKGQFIAAPPTAPLRAEALAQASAYPAKPSISAPVPIETPLPRPANKGLSLVTLGLMGIACAMVLMVGIISFVLFQSDDSGGEVVSNNPTMTTAPEEEASPTLPTATETATAAPAETATVPAPTPDAIATAQTIAIEQLPGSIRSRERFFAIPSTSAPTIDGDLSEWDVQRFAPVSHIIFGSENIQSPADLAGVCAAQWTEAFFYVACQMQDDVLAQASSGNRLYEGDGLELHFDTRLMDDLGRRAMSEDDFQIGVLPGEMVGRKSEAYRWLPLETEASLPAVTTASRAVEGGYSFETQVPWAEVGIVPQAGGVYGFGLVMNDNDTPDTIQQESQLSLFSTHEWSNPPSWGLLLLLE
jgi:serine/threonine protein kinase